MVRNPLISTMKAGAGSTGTDRMSAAVPMRRTPRHGRSRLVLCLKVASHCLVGASRDGPSAFRKLIFEQVRDLRPSQTKVVEEANYTRLKPLVLDHQGGSTSKLVRNHTAYAPELPLADQFTTEVKYYGASEFHHVLEAVIRERRGQCE
jgi:hypothetical protein